MDFNQIIAHFDLDDHLDTNGTLRIDTPIDGSQIAALSPHSAEQAQQAIDNACNAFKQWRATPAPVRGELIRIFGNILRAHKQELGTLVTLECGKILTEGLGEVQEMIDICDLATGQSRQLFGKTIASERPGHHMRESWHPLGVVGIITAFNFPVAPWAWNFANAIVCGDTCIWKPSEITPLTGLACQKLFDKAVAQFLEAGHDCPDHLSQVVIGAADIGEILVKSHDVPLISATGSVPMGKKVAPVVAQRLGRTILELGGNNGMIVTESADLDMALRAILFGAVGTCGQRCTSLRRLIVHKSVKDKLLQKLVPAYESVRIGNPLDKDTLVGPLINQRAWEAMEAAIENARKQGANILTGGDRVDSPELGDGHYVRPAIVDMPEQTDLVRTETFAPILYVMEYENFDQAIAIHNDVPQGLSSCIFTNDVKQSETFLSSIGSDCGIANVNIGPSGAEIGGAFGGEKETGGGRESGSDVWRDYMRRQTQTINYSDEMPLAQGVKFDAD